MLARHDICSGVEADNMMLSEALIWSVRISKEIELVDKVRRGV